ncbi:bifunctional TH2 protein, mitochondrial isoform X2 [Solanum pennellii]|uniref:Bifunctional TH2 protein, mitochondrial isoform X2 n=1 Tax=Solanum pennellii TaxID=28526 RepID=A0ABM1V9N3_SOLPN|nr:bifunctional TH2 protein, mitochondrial isoform X2 [Solanum pennellii]
MRSLLLLSPLRLPIPNPVFNFLHSKSIFRFYCRPSHYLRSAITPATMASPIDESVGVARRCWINSKKESSFALYTPFVVCLASGTLNLDTFRHYIAQDVHFLKAFVQGCEAAEVCTDDDDAKVGISELRKNIVNELKMHDAVLEEWGIDLVKECTINPATAKYTDFLLATASGKVEGVKAAKLATPFEKTKLAAYTLGAMTPCMRLYAYIGKELQVCLEGEKNHPYEKWIDSYASEGFQASALQTEDLLDKLSVTLTAPKSDQNQPENQISRMSLADLKNAWGDLSKQYTEEYEQCIEKMLLTEKAEKCDYGRLCRTIEQLSDFEKRANSRVVESGVLKGLNLEDIKRAGQQLILQDGCTDFFQSIIRNENLNADIHVLSYCWCGDLIRSSFSSGGIDGLDIHANELIFQESLSTGEIDKKVESPIDKVQAFSKILSNCRNDKKNLTVYIGDSVGDLLCLLEADVGIVLGSSSSLRRVGNHFGVSFVPLFPGVLQKQKMYAGSDSSSWTGLSGVLYTASSWAEIHAFVLGS